MNALTGYLLPHCPGGLLIGYDTESNSYRIGGLGLEGAAILAALPGEWLEIVRREATLSLASRAEEQKNAIRPLDFADLSNKLALGRLRPDEQTRLNAYYDALEAVEQEISALQAAIDAADSVRTINALPWPEWAGWDATPENPGFVLEEE